jgi:uncharacterized protein (DUF433 family)
VVGLQELTNKLDMLQQTVVHIERRLQWVEKHESGKIRTDHPSIVRIQGVCGGRPVIDGTRISVKAVVGWVRLGMSPQEIIDQHPIISASQVAQALAYYHDHPEEIEAEFAEEQRYLEQEIPRLQQLVTIRRTQGC